MDLANGAPDPIPNLQSSCNGETPLFSDDLDSTCSTPYVSAPSSPGRGPLNGGFFYSCPASPMHFAICATASATSSPDGKVCGSSSSLGYEFEFSARMGGSGSGQQGLSMSSADELFLNGKIRPMKLSTHLERPQLLDVEEEEEEGVMGYVGESSRGRDLRLRDKSLRRRTRSLSPLRSTSFEFGGGGDDEDDCKRKNVKMESCREESRLEAANEGISIRKSEEETMTASGPESGTSSRSSSAGRNSKRWVFLKDFLYRSKSEGRSNNKFWSNISFSPSKDKKPTSVQVQQNQVGNVSKDKANNGSNASNVVRIEREKSVNVKGSGGQGKKPVNGVGKRRVPTPSPHELHYKASRAQAEEMRKKTFLPYRQGLLGCLGFSSKSYGAMNGFARALNPVSSR